MTRVALSNLRFHYRGNRCCSLAAILSNRNPIHTVTPYFSHAADGGDGLQIAANVLNMQSRPHEKKWASSLTIGRRDNDSLP